MPRPCSCGRYAGPPEHSGKAWGRRHGNCMLCYLYDHDPRYRTLWSANDKQRGRDVPQLPPLTTRVANFSAALVRHVLDGLSKREQPEIERLLAICQSNDCGQFTGTACAKCGCNCKSEGLWLNKLAWASEHCPEGRW